MDRNEERALEEQINEVVSKHHERKSSGEATVGELSGYRQELKDLRAKLQELRSEGADTCPECGVIPHVLRQPSYYELRCLSGSCLGKRQAKGRFLEDAIEAWNDEQYFEHRVQPMSIS